MPPQPPNSCAHQPACPSSEGTDRDAAAVVAAHPEQGWSLLCNGIVLFDDLGELLPNGRCVGARDSQPTGAVPMRRPSRPLQANRR